MLFLRLSPYTRLVNAAQGLCNGRMSCLCPSVCHVDRQQQRHAAGLLLSSSAGSRCRSTVAGYRSMYAGARAVAAGSVMLRAEVRGSTQTRCMLFFFFGIKLYIE